MIVVCRTLVFRWVLVSWVLTTFGTSFCWWPRQYVGRMTVAEGNLELELSPLICSRCHFVVIWCSVVSPVPSGFGHTITASSKLFLSRHPFHNMSVCLENHAVKLGRSASPSNAPILCDCILFQCSELVLESQHRPLHIRIQP